MLSQAGTGVAVPMPTGLGRILPIAGLCEQLLQQRCHSRAPGRQQAGTLQQGSVRKGCPLVSSGGFSRA